MEKISGILRGSPRLRSVDTSSSQPVRPGAPAFGRTVGKNSLGDTKKAMDEQAAAAAAPTDRVSIGESEEDVVRRDFDKATYKSPEKSRKAVIDELQAKFFVGEPRTLGKNSDEAKSEELVEDMQAKSTPTDLRKLESLEQAG